MKVLLPVLAAIDAAIFLVWDFATKAENADAFALRAVLMVAAIFACVLVDLVGLVVYMVIRAAREED